jgi:hypothetical protein
MNLVPMLQKCDSVCDVKQRSIVSGLASAFARDVKVPTRGVTDHHLAQGHQGLAARKPEIQLKRIFILSGITT